MVYYPIYGNWVWGGGWLAQLGSKLGLGHGVLDFAGGSVVHMSAGFAALAGAYILGKREDKQHQPANIPFIILGTGMLWFGWFGFNVMSAGAINNISGLVAMNSLLAMVGGVLASLLFSKSPNTMFSSMIFSATAIVSVSFFLRLASSASREPTIIWQWY
jgi:Amt family ammonium transporter